MPCPSESRIQDYLAERLGSTEADEVDAHVAGCSKCKDIADSLSDQTLERPPNEGLASERTSPSCTDGSGLGESRAPQGTGNSDGFDEEATQASEPYDPTADLANQRHSDPAGPQDDPHYRFGHHSKLGRFELKHRLGFGGFGVVYLAYDSILKREVALKLPRHVALADSQVRTRFLREAQAAAGLFHPNIVPLYDAGEVDDVCYLASAYCPGLTLSQWIKQIDQPIDPNTAAQIIQALAAAIEHAHRAGILHRDIKPGNVMLDERVPMGELPFTPRLTDFGLAMSIDTETNQLACDTIFGTPRYMAPEQASGRDQELGPPTEVYSLGVILYEMLAGRPPISGSSNVDALYRVATEQPVPIRQWSPNVPVDLEAICAKSMEKKPSGRYATAAELADDLGRYLGGETTTACPDTAMQAAKRWVHRNPAHAGLVGVLAIMGVFVIGGLFAAYNQPLNRTTIALRDALNVSREAEGQTRETRRHTEQMLYVSDMNRAARAWQEGDCRDLFGILQRHVPTGQGIDQRGFEWWWYWGLVCNRHELITTHTGAVYFVTYSPDERWIASGGQDGIIELSEAVSPRKRYKLSTGQREVNGFDFSSNGQRLASAGDDGSVCVWDWQAEGDNQILRIDAFESLAFGVLFAQSDKLLVSCGNDPEIRLWDATTGAPAGTLSGHERAVEQIAISPDGRFLASAGRDQKACLWDLETRQRILTLHGDASRLTCIAFSPDGATIATGSVDGLVTLWNVSDGSRIATCQHLDGVHSVVFSADGELVYACDRGGIICRWPEASIRSSPEHPPIVRDSWTAHEGRAYWLALSRDGRQLVSAGEDGLVKCWNPMASKASVIVNSESQAVDEFAFASSGKAIVGVSDEAVRRWDVTTGEQMSLDRVTAPGRDVTFCCTDDWMALGEADGVIQVRDATAGMSKVAWRVDTHAEVEPLCFLNREHDLAVIDEDGGETIFVFSYTGEKKNEIPAEPYCELAAASPDETLLAFNVLNDIVLWNLNSDQQVTRLQAHASSITAIVFRHNGRQLVTASKDRTVKIWDMETGALRFTCAGHRSAITSAAFSPDGRTIASCDQQGVIKLWHAATGLELCNLRRESQAIQQIAFSPDGRRLAYLLEDGRIVLLSVEFSGSAW